MPPWQMSWPLSMSSLTVSVQFAHPGEIALTSMPSMWAARSRANIAAATRAASAVIRFRGARRTVHPAAGTRDWTILKRPATNCASVKAAFPAGLAPLT